MNCKHPRFWCLFVLYIVSAIIGGTTGGLLLGVDTSKTMDAISLKDASFVIGILSAVFSLLFIWNAVELGILLCCGRRHSKNYCCLDKIVRDEMIDILESK